MTILQTFNRSCGSSTGTSAPARHPGGRWLPVLGLTLLLFFTAAAQQPLRLYNWKFSVGDNPAWAAPGFNDGGWNTIRTGLTWEEQGFPGYDGYGWYRTGFTLPADPGALAVSDSLLFSLGRIHDCDQAFLNGQLIGQNARDVVGSTSPRLSDLSRTGEAWNIRRYYKIAVSDPSLHWGGHNTLAIRVYDAGGTGGLVNPSQRVGGSHPPEGRLRQFRFTGSHIFPGTTRDITLYIPAGLNPAIPACVYIGQDGHSPEFTEALDTLIELRKIPPMVGIFITPGTVISAPGTGAPRNNRCYEYDALGDEYARFLLDELLPYIADTFALNLSRDGNDRCIGGCSSGGICAFNAAWERPDAFQRVYSSSGSYVSLRGGDILPALLRKYEARPIRIFAHVATRDLDNSGGNWWFTNQQLERSLAYSGYDYHFVSSEAAHCEKFRQSFPEAMTWLWRDYPAPVKAGPGPPAVRDILQPGQDWQPVQGSFERITSLAAGPGGEVFVLDGAANRLYRVDPAGETSLLLKDARHLSGICTGPRGQLFGVSETSGQLLSVNASGKCTVIAKGIFGSALAAAPNGGFYVTGQREGRGTVWFVSGSRPPRQVDTGLQRATGCALSADGWQLLVSDGGSHWVYSYSVNPDGTLANRQRLHWLHVPDGADDSGAAGLFPDRDHLYVATRMGIQSLDEYGHNQAVIPPPGTSANALCLGGRGFDRLFVAGGNRLFSRQVRIRGQYAWMKPSTDN